ncbi:hypothetical protein BS78_09G075700 [Paspalum vaginatum]|nr:hypothetical protein BS78_09G075700 [Paspalum vaginatum]
MCQAVMFQLITQPRLISCQLSVFLGHFKTMKELSSKHQLGLHIPTCFCPYDSKARVKHFSLNKIHSKGHTAATSSPQEDATISLKPGSLLGFVGYNLETYISSQSAVQSTRSNLTTVGTSLSLDQDKDSGPQLTHPRSSFRASWCGPYTPVNHQGLLSPSCNLTETECR